MQLHVYSHHAGQTWPALGRARVCVCVACAACDAAPASLATPVLQPPLLNRPGMGAKLVSYYRKRDAADTGHQKLKQGEPPGMPAHSTGLARVWSSQLLHTPLHGWSETGDASLTLLGCGWPAACRDATLAGGHCAAGGGRR